MFLQSPLTVGGCLCVQNWSSFCCLVLLAEYSKLKVEQSGLMFDSQGENKRENN